MRRSAGRPNLVLLDLSLPDRDGLSLIREWASTRSFRTPVDMLSAYGSVDNALEATRLGAADFLEKPVALPKLLAAVPTAAWNPAGQVQAEHWARSA